MHRFKQAPLVGVGRCVLTNHTAPIHPPHSNTHPPVHDARVGLHYRADRVPVALVAHKAVAALLVELDLKDGAEAWGV
jgi:hypothetical protein